MLPTSSAVPSVAAVNAYGIMDPNGAAEEYEEDGRYYPSHDVGDEDAEGALSSLFEWMFGSMKSMVMFTRVQKLMMVVYSNSS